jgi:hypothetical protein
MNRAAKAVIIVLVVAGAALWLVHPWRQAALSVVSSGKTALEAWCGEQCKGLANKVLRPRLEFSRVVYEYPATAAFHDVQLIDEGVPFVEARIVRVTFSEIPKTGEPLVIEEVELVDSTLLIRTLSDGVLLGFEDLFLREEDERAPADEDAGGPLSASVAIRRARVVNGSLAYELPDGSSMHLREMNLDVASNPHVEPGWYAVDLSMERRNLLTLEIKSRLNVDALELDVERWMFDLQLNEERYEVLPPQLQEMVRSHEVRGHLVLEASGFLPLTTPSACDMKVTATLRDAFMSFGDYVLPAEELLVKSHVVDQQIHLQPATFRGLGGTIGIEGMLLPASDWGFDVQVTAEDVRIEQLFRPAEGEEPKYAGRIQLQGGVRGVLNDLRHQLRGSADGTVEEGKLVNLVVFRELVAVAGGRLWGLRDRLSTHLELYADRIEYSDMEVVSAAIAARGHGTRWFDGRVDFTLNAGPLERAQTALGPLGDLFGAVTDRLVKYRITGQGGETEIAVKPLGIGAN